MHLPTLSFLKHSPSSCCEGLGGCKTRHCCSEMCSLFISSYYYDDGGEEVRGSEARVELLYLLV